MSAPRPDPKYNVFTIDLSAAGSKKQSGEFGLLLLIDARTTAGGLDLNALVRVRCGGVDRDAAPLTYGNAVVASAGVSEALIEWAAQPGTIVTMLITRAGSFDVSARPARQLVTQSIADQMTYDRETVGTSAGAIKAANATRQALALTADAANTGIIYFASDAAVSASTGYPLAAGASIVLNNTALVDAIADTAGQTLHVVEETS